MHNLKTLFRRLTCCSKGCNKDAKFLYSDEGLNQIFCKNHFNMVEHASKPIDLNSEFKIVKSELSELEKKLFYIQKQMAYIRSENEGIDPNSSLGNKQLELESKFNILKNRLKSIFDKTDQSVHNAKSQVIDKEKPINELLLYIKTEREMCNNIWLEIELTITEMQINIKAEEAFQAIVNSNINKQIDEENKDISSEDILNEIYDKEYKMIELPNQSWALVENLDKKI